MKAIGDAQQGLKHNGGLHSLSNLLSLTGIVVPKLCQENSENVEEEKEIDHDDGQPGSLHDVVVIGMVIPIPTVCIDAETSGDGPQYGEDHWQAPTNEIVDSHIPMGWKYIYGKYIV